MNFLQKLAGVFVGKIVLRAQLVPIGRLKGLKYLWARLFYTPHQIEDLNRLYDRFLEKNQAYRYNHPELHVNVKRDLYVTPQGSQLDTIEVSAPRNVNSDKYVILAWGRSDYYEKNLERIATDALNLKAKIISFNFRGVGHSQGQVYCEQDLIDDYYFQVKRLLDKGVPVNNIKCCYGHSLAGVIAIFALARLHDEGYRIKVYGDRPFADLIETSVTLYFSREKSRRTIVTTGAFCLLPLMILPLALFGVMSFLNAGILLTAALLSVKWNKTYPIYDNYVGALLEKMMRVIMAYKGNWCMNVLAAYDGIHEEFKRHLVVHTSENTHSDTFGERHVKEDSHDKVIPYPYSLHANSQKRRETKKALKEQLAHAQRTSAPDLHHIASKLNSHSNCKVTGGGHMAPLKELVTWYKSKKAKRHITGQEHFYAFAEPEHKHETRSGKQYKQFGSHAEFEPTHITRSGRQFK